MNEWLVCVENNNPILHVKGECRFANDCILAETYTELVVLDGLILNKKELFEKYQTENLIELVLKMRQMNPNDFFTAFRGPFTGMFFDKKSCQSVVFTNQTGESAVFYYISEKIQIFSSNFTILLDFLKEQKISVLYDEKAAHWMLTFGYLIDGTTFAKEIKRLCAGKALYLNNGEWIEKRYHSFKKDTIQLSDDEAIETIDKLFKQAVRRCFDKDLEYGFTQHLVDMSAGLDSRMVNCVAKKLGYSNFTNISYSQSGSEEELLAKAAAKFFGNKFIFEPLDDHKFVFDIKELLRGNYGTYLFTGITGGARLLSKIDFSRYGTEQTGLMGDGVIGGSYIKHDDFDENVESLRLAHILPLRYNPNSENHDNGVYGLYTRGFMGIMASWFNRKQYTFALSPFLDVDLIEFCFSLPSGMRRHHNLYWEWVRKYHPEALEVPTSRHREPVTTFEKTMDLVSYVFHKGLRVIRKTLFKLGFVKSRSRSDSSMNPYEYWYDTDSEMRAFINDYYDQKISLIAENKILTKEVETLFNSRIVLEKLMALTVLGMADEVLN